LKVIERQKLDLSSVKITFHAFSNAPKTMQPRFLDDSNLFSTRGHSLEMK